jgi:DNA-binding transcriptional LysR family regulator
VDVILEFDNIENIKRAVEIPSGIAILPEPSLAREVKAGTLVAVAIEGDGPEDRLTRPLAIIHRRHGTLEPAAAKFLELLMSPDLTREVAERPDPGPRVAAAASPRA